MVRLRPLSAAGPAARALRPGRRLRSMRPAAKSTRCWPWSTPRSIGARRRRLELLTSLYGSPDVPADMTRNINERLDQLAGIVIYSRQHCWRNRTWCSRATPWSGSPKATRASHLLARINGIHDAQDLRPAAS